MSLKRSGKSQPRLEESVYTPVVFPGDSNVLFESSLPSTSSASPPPRSTTYLGELSRKHAAHAQIVREEPASPPRCQGEDSDDEAAFAAREERVNTLRNRVQDALIKAERNPADGKWVFLAQLLRMGVTSGRGGRWFRVRTDLQPPESLDGPGLGWLNAKTEAEWEEWEKHYQEERRVKDKVERWKKKVQPPSKVSSMHRSLDVSADVGVSPVAVVTAVLPQNPTSDPTSATDPRHEADTAAKDKVTLNAAGSTSKPTTNALATLRADPLKDTAPFGFGVVKRLKTVPVGKPTAASGKPEAEKNGAQPDKAKEMAGPSKKVVDASKAKPPVIPASTRDTNIRHIADLPDLSFFPPSFPSSQMITSTPKAAAKPLSKTRKLESMPIIPAPPSDISDLAPKASSAPDPSSSPRVTKTYGRHNQGLSSSPRQPLEISASLPAIPTPSTPTRNARERNAKNINQVNDDDDNVKNTNNKRALPAPSTPNSANEDYERALKKARTLSTLDGLVATPSRNRAAPQQILTSFPRPRSPHTPKVRADDGGSIDVTVPAPALPTTSSPLTPLASTPIRQEKKQTMPTLTELLASAKRDKGKGKRKAVGGAVASPAKPESKGKAPEARPAPITEEDHAENEAWVNHEQPPPPPPADAPVYGYDTGIAFDVIHSEEVNQYLMDPYAIDPVQDPHSDHPGLDVDVSIDIDFSPTKSLSSLAGSDSEDELDDVDGIGIGMGMGSGMDFSFRPLATSTQRAPFGAPDPSTLADPNANHNSGSGYVRNESGASKDSWASIYASAGAGGGGSGGNGLPPSSSHPYPSYNSQFGSEVARQVDKVDKLLEKELDYEGWLRDPSEEADVGGYGQNSLGHEVEESP